MSHLAPLDEATPDVDILPWVGLWDDSGKLTFLLTVPDTGLTWRRRADTWISAWKKGESFGCAFVLYLGFYALNKGATRESLRTLMLYVSGTFLLKEFKKGGRMTK